MKNKKQAASSNVTREIRRDDFESNFSYDRSMIRNNYSHWVEELQPWIIENTDTSSYDIDNDNRNLVVNLEDLVNEEYYINRISEHIHK